MGWIESGVAVHGTTLHCHRRGQGVPLVLAHGATDNGRCWTRVAEQLEDEFDVIAYDARYHGKSGATPWDGGDGGSDLIGLVEAMAFDRPLAMGHSMGAGAVSQAMARRPDLFRAAVLEDPGWGMRLPTGGSESSAGLSTFTGWVTGLREQTLDEVIAAGRAATPTWHPDEFPDWAESKQQFRPSEDWLAGLGRGGSGAPWQDTVKRFERPVLLVCGRPELNAIVSAETAAEAKALCPSLEVIQLEAGHNIRREAFDGFVAAVREFLLAHRED